MKDDFRSKHLNDDFDIVLWGIFFDKLLENLDAYVMVSDIDGKVIFANTRCLSFFNFRESNLLGKKWISAIIPDTKRDEAEEIFARIKDKDQLVRFDTPVVATPNLEKFCYCVAVPLKENEGRLYMFLFREGSDPAKRKIGIRKSTPNGLVTGYRKIVQALYDASLVADAGTAVHETRVMSYAVILARRLNMEKYSIRRLKIACLMHDLGKIAIENDVLNKKGKLTPEEYVQIKKHPRWGAELMQLIYFLEDIIPIVAAHHEHYDGGGYPKGVSGENIPFEARVLSVADVYEALTADRPYRKGYDKSEALRIMEGEKGKKLDPDITDVFISMVKSGKFTKDVIDG